MTSGQQHKPCDIVLGAARRSPRRLAVIAGVAAAVLHLGAAAVAVALGASAERPVRRDNPPLVVIDHVIDLNPPAQPAPEAPPPPPPVASTPPPRSRQKLPPVAKAPEPAVAAQPEQAPPDAPEPEKPTSEPPPLAQAGQVVAAANNAESPAAFAIASGTASGFVGGTTAASGSGTKANHTGQVGTGTGVGYSKARPPQLHSRNWPCGWPSEADDLDVDEAFVTVRASIGADGSVQDIEVLSEPGHGFGKRAALCARTKVSFEPALDAEGRPSAGKTPPLRIRFVRSEE